MTGQETSVTGMGLSDELTRFILELDFNSCPDTAIKTAEQSILDTVGVALAGVDEESSRIASGYVDDIAVDGPSHILGRNEAYQPEFAAFVTGVQGHALDYDDVTYTFPIHPSVTFVPTLLALGESTGATGRELLAAYVAAFEFEIRVAGGVGDRLLESGLHPTAVVGVFGATAAAGRLLDLSPTELRRAMGIAASLSSGATSNFGTMTKPLHAGKANENGIRAARLASRGFTGNNAILDEPSGPWPTLFDDYNLEEWIHDLGDHWYAAEGIGIKRYPSCGCTHAAIDAASTLADSLPDDPASVSSIEVESVQAAVEQLRYQMPETPLQGKFSIHYCVASALVDGTVTLDHFTPDAISRPPVRDLVRATIFDVDPSLGDGTYVGGSMPSRVTVTTEDGGVHMEMVTAPSGMPENPLLRDELETKFCTCAGRALNDQSVEDLLGLLNDLSAVVDVSRIPMLASR